MDEWEWIASLAQQIQQNACSEHTGIHCSSLSTYLYVKPFHNKMLGEKRIESWPCLHLPTAAPAGLFQARAAVPSASCRAQT